MLCYRSWNQTTKFMIGRAAYLNVRKVDNTYFVCFLCFAGSVLFLDILQTRYVFVRCHFPCADIYPTE